MAEITIPAGAVEVSGDLQMPREADGIVLFAHGSGSSRHSPRNRAVASRLNEAGFATVLFDLLTALEEGDRRKVFDIELLAQRLRAATAWADTDQATSGLPVGYFGASTGAAAALWAAADEPRVRAVVSRGGRPDLAIPRLPQVTAPTLLLVGGADEPVLGMNKEAREHLAGPSELHIVAGATHLFEEPGALEEVADRAAEWLLRHLVGDRASRR